MEENLLHAKIVGLLNWFNSSSEKPVSLAEVEKFFAHNIEFYLNNQLLATGIHAYLERLNALKAKCKSLKIKLPAKEIVVEGNRAAVNWEESLHFHDGSMRHLVNAAFIHFDRDGKIVKFSDVFNGADPV